MSRSVLIVGLLFSVAVHGVLMCWPAPAAAPTAAPSPPVVVPVLETELARLETTEPAPVAPELPVEEPAPLDPAPAAEPANHEALDPLFDEQEVLASTPSVEPPPVVEPPQVAEPQRPAEAETVAAAQAPAEPELVASKPEAVAEPESLADPEAAAPPEPEAEILPPEPEPEPEAEPEPETVQPPRREPEPIVAAAETPVVDEIGPAVTEAEPSERQTSDVSDTPRVEPGAPIDDVEPPASPAEPYASPTPHRPPARGGGRSGAAEGRRQPVLRIDWGSVAHARATINAGDMLMVVLAEGRNGPMIVGEIVEQDGRWQRSGYQPAAGSTRYSNRLRVVDDVPAFDDVRRDSALAAGEHLAILVPVVLERRFESAQLEAAFSRGLIMQEISSFGGRFDLQNGALRFHITQVGEDRQ